MLGRSMNLDRGEWYGIFLLLTIFSIGLYLSLLSFLRTESGFWLRIILVFLFLVMPIHELGHFLSAKKLGYKPSAIVLSLFFAARGVTTIEGKNDLKRRIHKFTGLFSSLLIIPLLIFFWRFLGAPSYNTIWFWFSYLILATLTASHDISGFWDLISGEESEKEANKDCESGLFSSILRRALGIDEILPDFVFVTSKDNWVLWKDNYPKEYKELAEGRTVIFKQ